jgi:hypothetical protein
MERAGLLTAGKQSGRLADAIVRNDEVVGSSPTSSTKDSITCKFPIHNFCPTLSHKTISGPAGVASNSKLVRVSFTLYARFLLGCPVVLGNVFRDRKTDST